ncbi:MAG: hypothetical protein HY554_04030 [Elusimicrobia bacterium]|nr:hypothetical protein [Elusimicrobiota bacterium]
MLRRTAEPLADLGWQLRPVFAMSCLAIALGALAWNGSRRLASSPAAPEILSFTADKLSVRPTEPITLRWKVVNAKKVLIKDPHGTVLEPTQSDSITMYLRKPGAYSFMLIALGENETVTSGLGGQ